MALQGTLRDFGLADILQLIGIQRKTGILTLENGREKVAVKFLEGSVVGAETGTGGVEERLGQVLVRTGKITEAQLQEALRTQQKTLQRLGHVLVHAAYISEEELMEALRVQSLQVIYRLFRWRDGRYNVDLVDQLDYDEAHFVPISSETILMEGARMVDEWPIIERRIKSDKMIFAKTQAAIDFDLGIESIVDSDIDFDFLGTGTDQETAEEPTPKEIQLSREERELLALVDGERTVEWINDHSDLGDFDTFRILSELVTRDLIREVKRAQTTGPDTRAALGLLERLVRVALVTLVGLVSIGAVATLEWNPTAPWRVSGQSGATDRLRFYASLSRLEQVEQALQVFYLDAATYPAELGVLAAGGYLAPDDLVDPWGRPYGFRISPGGYQVFGLDGVGEPHPELSRSHRFSAGERMMLPEELASE
jgi:hypothetical protein